MREARSYQIFLGICTSIDPSLANPAHTRCHDNILSNSYREPAESCGSTKAWALDFTWECQQVIIEWDAFVLMFVQPSNIDCRQRNQRFRLGFWASTQECMLAETRSIPTRFHMSGLDYQGWRAPDHDMMPRRHTLSFF